MTDCLIIGYNELVFSEYVDILKSMGERHPDFRDLNLNYINYENKPFRPLDIFTHLYYKQKGISGPPFHNSDLLWMPILYLGTFLNKNGLTFDYINLYQYDKEKLEAKLRNNDYLTIIITTTIYNFDYPITEIISFIKKYNTSSRIIVGGPFVSKRFERMSEQDIKLLFKYINADFYVYSREGEQALVKIIKAMKTDNRFLEIANISYKNGNDYSITKDEYELNLLDENPIDYSLFPIDDFGQNINIRASKGCPYNCAFCGFPKRSNKYLPPSVDLVRKELRAIKKLGCIQSFHFIDDTVNVPKKNFKEILKMMIDEKFDLKWNCYFRCDQVDEETIDLMKESGCEGVFLGLESADETILNNMNKSAKKELYYKYIPHFKNAGIQTFVSIFIGFPGETVKTADETIEFLRETGPDYYRAQLWYCDPVTPVWQNREKFGLSGSSFSWKHNTMDAETACDLLEDIFLKLDKPVWVPDPGYNYISIYLMRQRGVSFEKQKLFLRCFNALIKEKILFPDKKEPSVKLMENLQKSVMYDEDQEIDFELLDKYSDIEYFKTESHLKKEFELQGLSAVKERSVLLNSKKEFIFKNPDLSALSLMFEVGLFHILLSAFELLLISIDKNRNFYDILTMDKDRILIPFRHIAKAGMTFSKLSGECKDKYDESKRYQFFSNRIISGDIWKKRYGKKKPIFNFGFLMTETGGNCDFIKEYYPDEYSELILVAEIHDDKIIFHSNGFYDLDVIERIFYEIIHKIIEKDIVIDELKINKINDAGMKEAIKNLNAKSFNF